MNTLLKTLKLMALSLTTLVFLASSCGKDEPKPEPEPEAKAATFTVTLDASAPAPFKTTWSEGDAVQVIGVKNGKTVQETMTVSSVVSNTAIIKSKGQVTGDCDGYYAFIFGAGASGCVPASCWTVSQVASESRTVAVAKGAKGGSALDFKQLYSFIKVAVTDEAVKSLVLEGGDGEALNFDAVVSTSDFAVSRPESASFEDQTSLKVSVSGTGDCWFNIIPGTVLAKGYSVKAYDATGELIAEAESTEALTVEAGKVYEAPSLEESSRKKSRFDENAIAVSFGVVSDVHINGNSSYTDKWISALRQLKTKSAEKDADGMDGVLVVGDLIDTRSEEQLKIFKTAFESEIDVTKIPMVYAIGNHDVSSWTTNMVSDAAYMAGLFGENYFLSDRDNTMRTEYEARHCVIGSYHILAVSPAWTLGYDTAVINWLDSQLQAITEAEPEKYVIVLTHPMIYNTVYGSLLGSFWASDALTPALRKYPQVIVFGGHLHFPLNDPRSFWQGDFTACGCGSVRYMAIENGNYEDMRSATVMKDCEEFSQGNLLQFDESGNMRILRMDFYNKDIIGDPISAPYPTADKGHLVDYNHTTLSLANGVPSLSSLDVSVADGYVTATWAAGKDDEFVHHYVLTLKKNGATVATKKILADFYKYPRPAGMKSEWTRALGQYEDGTYELSLVAYDSWEASSNTLLKTFTIGATGANSGNVWTGDSEGGVAVPAGDGTASCDWLSYSSGRVSWTANTTGRPRTATVNLPDGSAYSVTQISVEDFKGNWSLHSKLFDINNTLGKGKVAAYENAVTFGDPLKAETLAGASGGSHTNNLGIRGLYFDSVLDACVEIDYEGHSVKFGVFFDRRSAQSAGGGRFMAYLPECSTGLWSGYLFAPGAKSFSTTDYDWLWFTVADGFKTLRYRYVKDSQKTSNSKYIIAGISCVKATSADASTLKTGTDSGYDVIYQANCNSSDDEGMYFVRK